MKDNDISISLSNFLMKLSGCWLATTHGEQIRRTIARNYTFIMLLFGVYIDISDICHSLDDINNFLYMFANLFFCVAALLKNILLQLNKKRFLKLVMYSRRNFWHSNYDDDEKDFVNAARKNVTFIVLVQYFVMIYIPISYVSIPVYENAGKKIIQKENFRLGCGPTCHFMSHHISKFISLCRQTENYCTIFAMFNHFVCIIENARRNHSERELPFKMWLDLPLHESPYFEIIFALQAMCTFHVGISYVCPDNFLILINTHTACQFRILQHKILNLLDPNSKIIDSPDYADKRYQCLRRYIRQHQALINYCDRIEIIFSFNMFSYVLVFSVVTCLSLYQALLGEISTLRRLAFVVYVCGSVFQLLMLTNSCGALITESTKVGNAAYKISWAALSMRKSGRWIRRDVQMIILRSQKPCQLTAGGFFPISLHTSTKLISSAMSYFTLLKQSSSNIQGT